MRRQDLFRLRDLWEHIDRGGFPDLGKPHSKAGYRFAIGHAAYEDGKVGPWRENLGRDKLTAQYRARAMVAEFISHVGATGGFNKPLTPIDRTTARATAWKKADRQMRHPREVAERLTLEYAGGRNPYSPGFKFVAIREAVPDDDSAPVTAAIAECEVSPTRMVLMLRRAAERWLVHLRQRFEAGDISDSHLHRVEGSVKRLDELVEDFVVAKIAKPELDAIRLAFQSKRKKSGMLRRRSTIDTELGHIRSFFQWMSDEELWTPCRDWERWLRAVHRNDENDDDADAEKNIDSYDLGELVRIYAAAPKSLKLWMLLALNFAWGAKEIDTARKRHFKIDSGQRRVARFRHKRRPGAMPVPGRWIAFPETWELALARMAKTPTDEATNPKGLAFMSRDGQRLVRYQTSERAKNRRYDVCADALKETCEEIGVKYRGFYALRRTAIDAIDKQWGERMADLFCQHRPKSMTAKHYTNKRWRKLFRVLEWWRGKLQPMFDAVA